MALQVQHDVSLQDLNTMAVPSIASHFTVASTSQLLAAALHYAAKHHLQPLVLGEGSNTLFSSDFSGLVILNRLLGIELLEDREHTVLVRVGAGENWHAWVTHCLQQGWHGLENLALIPGLVGAAPIQNIGAYGIELAHRVINVDVLLVESGESRQLSRSDCRFAYRDSIFKGEMTSKAVVRAVTFELDKFFDPQISYPALRSHFNSQTEFSAAQVYAAVCDIRSRKLPLPSQIPNTGSFFKNPIVSPERFEELNQQHPKIVAFKHNDGFKLAAAWLIEQAGWKERRRDGVGVHPEQALVIVNPEKRSGQSVLSFAKEIQADISRKYAVDLEIEPIIY